MAPVLSAVTAASAVVSSYIAPQDKFPPAAFNSMAVPRWEVAAQAKDGRLESVFSGADYKTYVNDRLPANCYYPLEVVLNQDSTYSFEDDFPVMVASELEEVYNGILANHPGSIFGVVSHTDKPIENFGWPATDSSFGDWCWRLEQTMSPNLSSLLSIYSHFIATGGNDAPQNQYGALINTIQSTLIGWGTVPSASQLIVIITDSPPHYDGDGSSHQGMANCTGVFDEDHADDQCVNEFYPTPAQAIDAVLSSASGRAPPYVAFVVYESDLTRNQSLGAWQWFAGQIREDNRFVRVRTEDSDNFWDQLSQIITVIDSLECQGTTTPVPTTTVPTTTEPTTTEAATTATETTTPAATTATETTTPAATTATTGHHGCPCPCPHPCPCDCPCNGDAILVRYPKGAESIDVHVGF